MVFVFILLIIFGLALALALRQWFLSARFSSYSTQNALKKTSHYLLVEEWQKAEKELYPLIVRGKGGKEASLLHVHVLRGTNRLVEALTKCREAKKLYPDELLLSMEEGKILLDLGRPKESLLALQPCHSLIRSESDHLVFAKAHHLAGEPKKAFELLSPWLEESKNGPLLMLAGDILYTLKKFQEAIALYTKASQFEINLHQLSLQLAHAYRRLGNLGAAESIFQKMIRSDPGDVEATLGLGLCLQERGYFLKATLIYQASPAWEGQDPRLLFQAGYSAIFSKKYSFAEQAFSSLLAKHPPTEEALAYLGYSLEKQKNWQAAEQVYLKLIHSFPSSFRGYRALAWLFGVGLSQTLSPQQGLSLAHRALKLKEDPMSLEILSACLARVGEFEKAYHIQALLSESDTHSEARTRRQQALRTLRKRTPLEDFHVFHSLVA